MNFKNSVSLILLYFVLVGNVARCQEVGKITHQDELDNYLRQTTKGRILVGCDFGLGLGVRTQNALLNNATVIFDFDINPKVGYNLTDRFTLGIGYENYISLASIDYTNDYQFAFNSVNGFVRYYFPKGFFLEPQYGVGSGSERLNINASGFSESTNGSKVSLGLGFANFWGKNYHLEILAKYTAIFGDYKEGSGNFFINGVKVTAGFTYSFENLFKKV